MFRTIRQVIEELETLPEGALVDFELTYPTQYQVRYKDGSRTHDNYLYDESACRSAAEEFKEELEAVLWTRQVALVKLESGILMTDWLENKS